MRWFKRPALETPHDDSGDDGNASVDSVLTMPATGIDPDWRERIEVAKREYEEAKKRRKGKPILFRMSRPLILADDP